MRIFAPLVIEEVVPAVVQLRQLARGMMYARMMLHQTSIWSIGYAIQMHNVQPVLELHQVLEQQTALLWYPWAQVLFQKIYATGWLTTQVQEGPMIR